MEADRKANVDLTHRGVRRPDEKDSINFFLPYLSGLNLNAHARVMEFAAMQFNPLRIGQQGNGLVAYSQRRKLWQTFSVASRRIVGLEVVPQNSNL
jgi:hypothetical protein